MSQAGAALLAVRVLPVGHASKRGSDSPQAANAHQHVRGFAQAFVTDTAQVEHGGARPSANGNVGQSRVQGMLEPHAVEGVLGQLGLLSALLQHVSDGLLQGIRQRFQESELVEELFDELNHGVLLESCRRLVSAREGISKFRDSNQCYDGQDAASLG